jgi:hypothetical protein
MSRTVQRLCPCGNKQHNIGKNKKGETIYARICKTCRTKGRRTKKDHCERCGFIAEDPCQLDVDHIDADGSNNEPSNLQTLCANCHRLKTKQNQDWKKDK